MKRRNVGLCQKAVCHLAAVLCLMSVLLTGCSVSEMFAAGEKTDKVRDLEFTVVGEDRQPEELKQILEEKKAEPFKMTYTDQEYLYICVGYGAQKTGGYSIAVNELYLTGNAVYIDTNLLGPSPEEQKKEGTSYPYIVVKTEYLEQSVVFD